MVVYIVLGAWEHTSPNWEVVAVFGNEVKANWTMELLARESTGKHYKTVQAEVVNV